MSALSSKCDGLRNAADELQNVIDNAHNYTWPGIVSTLHYAQQGLRDAANIIWGLSCKLAGVVDQQDEIERLEDENARLRSCLSDDAENARQIMAENAKLRELCADMWTCIREGEWDCSDCPRYARCNDGVSEFIDRMRELGVEVTE